MKTFCRRRMPILPGFLAFICILLCTQVLSQPNITRVEYYVDNDPGYGKATALIITVGTNLTNLSINVDIAPLSSGVHIVGVRSQDENGAWSFDNKWLFVKPFANSGSGVPNITMVEYYIQF